MVRRYTGDPTSPTGRWPGSQLADVEAAPEGTTFTVPKAVGGATYTVGPKCDISTAGHWYCVTHKKAFRNQLEKDFHIGNGQKHVLAWACHEHGRYETP